MVRVRSCLKIFVFADTDSALPSLRIYGQRKTLSYLKKHPTRVNNSNKNSNDNNRTKWEPVRSVIIEVDCKSAGPLNSQ